MTFPDPSAEDLAAVTRLLGREPEGRFRVVVRHRGAPAVIENEPHLRDGTPMPTLYWLVEPQWHAAVSRLESEGGVHRYESLVSPDDLAAAHRAYAERRAAATVREGAVAPSGGVGGTRVGVKCLHAHLAYYLAGGNDPVGALVAEEIGARDYVREDVGG